MLIYSQNYQPSGPLVIFLHDQAIVDLYVNLVLLIVVEMCAIMKIFRTFCRYSLTLYFCIFCDLLSPEWTFNL